MFDTSKYNLQRKEDGSIVRVFGNGAEEPEMTGEYYTSQIEFHQQAVDDLTAQLEKLEALETDNPATLTF